MKGCTRSEGFSTPNDLDRHKRSLHPDEHADGDRYRCQVGPCFNKNKIWPRADNFRAHMKRVHQKELIKDEDLDQYKYRYRNTDSKTLGRVSNCFVRPEAPPKDDSDVARNSTVSEFDRLNIFPDGGGNDASDNWKLPRSPVIDLSTDTNPVEGPSQIQIEEPTLVIELVRAAWIYPIALPHKKCTWRVRILNLTIKRKHPSRLLPSLVLLSAIPSPQTQSS